MIFYYELIDVNIEHGKMPIAIIKCFECNDEFEAHREMIYWRNKNNTTICTNCNPIGISTSGLEKQLISYIRNNYNDSVLINNRDIINPLELDIYLPDLNLAFEFNGLYWHSELNKDKKYHLYKTNECLKRGIQLIHIWEDDWKYKNDIIKSMILNKINKSKCKYFARKCDIREISDNKLVKRFLNDNHIQGFSGSKIKIGLFYDDELVSLMTFGNLRKVTGLKSKDGFYELIRFCNKINTNIVGGASKIFKYFINNYNPKTIISYSDNSYSNGNLYDKLGFIQDSQTDVNYSWVVNGIRKHRYNYRKSELVKIGYDGNKTEKDIMYEDFGSYRVWNSGQKKWIFKNNI